MKVLCVPAGDDPSSHLRIREPARALAEQGANVEVWNASWMMRERRDRSVIDVVAPPADVLVLCRVQSRQVVESIPHLQRQGVAVVIDLDDDLGRVDPSNIAYADFHPGLNSERSWRWTEEACRLADMVTVTTPALAQRYGGHGRVRVVPNRIPAAEFVGRDVHEGLRIGWAGAVGTHPRDLQTLGGSIPQVLGPRGLAFHNVGPARGIARAIGYPKVLATGSLAYDQWVQALGMLDVGVVPLADTAFNQSKSCLKSLQLAAAGVPSIASPTPDNRRVASDGVCELASRPREWASKLTQFCLSPTMARERGEAAFAAALGHVLEDHCGEFYEAWEVAAKHRAAQPR